VLGVSILPPSKIFLFDFGIVPTVWYFLFFYWILELFRERGIFCFFIGFWNCSDSVVFLFVYWILELFQKCGIFLFYFLLLILLYSVNVSFSTDSPHLTE